MGDTTSLTDWQDTSRSQKIMDSITLALGRDVRYFDILLSGVMLDEPDILSVLVQFSPREDLDFEDTVVAGSKVHLQFDIVDDDPQLILGEDDEIEITKGNLYAAMYWSEVCKCKSDAAPQPVQQRKVYAVPVDRISEGGHQCYELHDEPVPMADNMVLYCGKQLDADVQADHNRLVRELDVLLNGEEGAAQQASLCDIVKQVEMQGIQIKQEQPAPVPTGEWLPDFIYEIAERLRTQDNRITADPIFAVQRLVKHIAPEGYGDSSDWRETESGDYCPADERTAKRLDALHRAGRDTGKWQQFNYHHEWEFVTACFTEAAALEHIKLNGHNLGKTRTYAYSAFRNPEWIQLREWMMGLRKPAEREGGAV